MKYFAFGDGQPNGSFGSPQDCLLLYVNNRYNLHDNDCDYSKAGFICEK